MARSALADLEAITTSILRDNPSRALSFVAELRESCLALAQFPEAYPVMPRHARLGIRRKPAGRYLIFFKIRTDVEIIHVLHGARDYDRILRRHR